MKFNKKIRIFALVCALFVLLFTVAAFATDVDAPAENETVVETEQASNKLDQNIHGKDMTFGERLEYALQGTVTGMLMVFSVLGLLFGIISLSKVFLYDIPNRDKSKGKKENKNAPVETTAPTVVAETAPVAEESADDGELAAVITAAIAAMLDSEEYKNEFVGGFRVVSFKRSAKSAWNKK
jgi:sodium pump decarboxylase gamma subunit